MSAIINASINLDLIPEGSTVKGAKGTYLNLAIFVNDETKFGNNVSIQVPQSKEEREAKANRIFYGNGKVAWVSPEGVTIAEKEGEGVPF